jgi:hypothetical protein
MFLMIFIIIFLFLDFTFKAPIPLQSICG